MVPGPADGKCIRLSQLSARASSRSDWARLGPGAQHGLGATNGPPNFAGVLRSSLSGALALVVVVVGSRRGPAPASPMGPTPTIIGLSGGGALKPIELLASHECSSRGRIVLCDCGRQEGCNPVRAPKVP